MLWGKPFYQMILTLWSTSHRSIAQRRRPDLKLLTVILGRILAKKPNSSRSKAFLRKTQKGFDSKLMNDRLRLGGACQTSGTSYFKHLSPVEMVPPSRSDSCRHTSSDLISLLDVLASTPASLNLRLPRLAPDSERSFLFGWFE
jgi:hypothetical protein